MPDLCCEDGASIGNAAFAVVRRGDDAGIAAFTLAPATVTSTGTTGTFPDNTSPVRLRYGSVHAQATHLQRSRGSPSVPAALLERQSRAVATRRRWDGRGGQSEREGVVRSARRSEWQRCTRRSGPAASVSRLEDA